MYEIIDTEMMQLIDGLAGVASTYLSTFVSTAQAIAAIMTTIYFSSEAYKMMAGDKQLEIVPLLRPFGIGLIIMFWGSFLRMIDAPLNGIHNAGKDLYISKVNLINNLNKQRTNLQDSLCIAMVNASNEVKAAEEESRDGFFQKIEASVDLVAEKIAGLGLYVIGKIRQLVFNIIETIVTLLYQAIIYLMLFLRLVFRGVLGIIGPLALAFSILPMWKLSFRSWLSKYITVSLYGCVTYIILALSTAVIQYAIQTDIQVLSQANIDDTAQAMQAIYSTGYINGWLPAMLMTICSIALVPKITEWILPAGAADVTAGFRQNVNNTVTSAAGAAVGGVAGGAAGAMAGAKIMNNGNNNGGGYAGGGYAGGSNGGGSNGGSNSGGSNNDSDAGGYAG